MRYLALTLPRIVWYYCPSKIWCTSSPTYKLLVWWMHTLCLWFYWIELYFLYWLKNDTDGTTTTMIDKYIYDIKVKGRAHAGQQQALLPYMQSTCLHLTITDNARRCNYRMLVSDDWHACLLTFIYARHQGTLWCIHMAWRMITRQALWHEKKTTTVYCTIPKLAKSVRNKPRCWDKKRRHGMDSWYINMSDGGRKQ